MPRRLSSAQVAASSTWTDPDGVRRPAGDVHAWVQGKNQTVCGLALSRSSLARFPHVQWREALPESGPHADAVQHVCTRCRAALAPRGTVVDRRAFRRP
ncbi:hypothetical protein [Cellulomonas xiejunii]|uniref:DUF3565 domain-containing protein n=1 Tax=Cellulomonas xiejunii TaxID=2968083 RepID=A0ABY5KPT1_9CELL|nr:hypothetical protein [Cellulomonas xiejunii]MCC2320026.1 hypothetical protein [Cellulomonas xiejunii]UUI70343.1 hypothetical protein NP048_11010 [Cellulomonas xiejunii]